MAQKTPRAGEASAAAWDLREIRKLIDLLVEREIGEFEMEKDGLRIRIKRGEAPSLGVSTAPAASSPVFAPPAPPAGPAAAAPSRAGASEGAEAVEGLHIVKSPIVGTFYASAAPNAPPFVKLGDVVQVGQVLCIIEAMKLMNEIESDVAGEVVRIYVENGQPVEYGQSLFAIKPSHKKP